MRPEMVADVPFFPLWRIGFKKTGNKTTESSMYRLQQDLDSSHIS